MNIVVLGAGAWGTALAVSATRVPGANRVRLWARDASQRALLLSERANQRYLPGTALPESLSLSPTEEPWPEQALAAADLVVIGSPMSALRSVLGPLAGHGGPVVWLCKGFEAPLAEGEAGLMGHEVAAQVAPGLRLGVLSGPSFAQEVARGQPTALVAASTHIAVRDAMVAAFHGPALRVYASDDVVGVEVGGAVKNVLAIATGLCDGLQLGLNARAALVTRGLAEMTRLGLALGARPDTFMGLSGLGDLVLTATGDLSRNRRVGQLLAQGLTTQQAVDSLGHVAEGVYSARSVVLRARQRAVDMPISEAVLSLLDGRWQPAQALASLMGREPREEGF